METELFDRFSGLVNKPGSTLRSIDHSPVHNYFIDDL